MRVWKHLCPGLMLCGFFTSALALCQPNVYDAVSEPGVTQLPLFLAGAFTTAGYFFLILYVFYLFGWFLGIQLKRRSGAPSEEDPADA